MIPAYNIEYKTIATVPWKKEQVINSQQLDGWNFVREERVTARKVAVVFYKKVFIPPGSNPDAEVRKYLAENLTESDSM